MQISLAYLHLGWNTQPLGGSMRFGMLPGITSSVRVCVTLGTALSKASVYGCLGAVNSAFVSAASITFPA